MILDPPYTLHGDLDEAPFWFRPDARRQEGKDTVLRRQGAGCLVTLLAGVVRSLSRACP